MWWLFQKVSDAAGQVVYNYSRGSDDKTGRIVYNKSRQEIVEFKHCSNDSSNFDRKVAVDKFACFVIDEGFPSIRKVVCG